MARHATILYHTIDYWGDWWAVREERNTVHGHDWPLLLGWPLDKQRGRGGAGGPRVIVTAELADWLEQNRRETLNSLALPIGNNAIKRLRRLLGFHRYRDAATWWLERLDDLEQLTYAEFGQKHQISAAAAATVHRDLFGRKLRPSGWWRKAPARAVLLSNQPRAVKADLLGISVGAVGRLVWELRIDNGGESTDD